MAKTMLVIEDNLTIQEIVALAFEETDFEVIRANDAADGLQRLRSLLPDIVLADASLPDLDGFQLCQMIRETSRLRHVPVLLLISELTEYDRGRGDRAGVTGHLSKPFEPVALRQLVHQILIDPVRTTHQGRSVATDVPAWSADPPPFAWLDTPAAARSAGATDTPPPEAGRAADTPPALPAAVSDEQLLQALGRSVVAMFREALHAHVETLFERLTPQILTVIQEVVEHRVPELLETLLQQEIDKLKQAVEDDETHGDQ